MKRLLEKQISDKKVYVHKSGTGIQFASYTNDILNEGLKI
jgi:hypothetical protein